MLLGYHLFKIKLHVRPNETHSMFESQVPSLTFCISDERYSLRSYCALLLI